MNGFMVAQRGRKAKGKRKKLPPSPEGKVGGDASPEIIIAIASYFC